MRVMDLKYRYHTSLDIFGYSAIFSVVMLFISLFLADKWMIIFIPGILLFSIIGLFFVSQGLIVLTSKEGATTEMSEDDYVERLYGIDAFRLIFIVLAIIIAVCIFAICFFYVPNIVNFSNFSVLSFVYLVALIYITYRVSRELSFVVMSVTIVKTMRTYVDDDSE